MTSTPTKAKKPKDRQSLEFTYETESGAVLTIPRFKTSVTSGMMRRYRKLDGLDQFYSLMEDILDAEQLAVTDEMSSDGFDAFVTAWQADSGVTLGEPSAS